jgi:hypothetical protein
MEFRVAEKEKGAHILVIDQLPKVNFSINTNSFANYKSQN